MAVWHGLFQGLLLDGLVGRGPFLGRLFVGVAFAAGAHDRRTVVGRVFRCLRYRGVSLKAGLVALDEKRRRLAVRG